MLRNLRFHDFIEFHSQVFNHRQHFVLIISGDFLTFLIIFFLFLLLERQKVHVVDVKNGFDQLNRNEI